MSKVNELFSKPLNVVNIGLESFYEELKSQDVNAIHVDWRPPAGGNVKMNALLSKLKNK